MSIPARRARTASYTGGKTRPASSASARRTTIPAGELRNAKREAFDRPEVEAFLRYALENHAELAEASQYVPLTEEQAEKALADFEAALEEPGS